MTKPQEYKETYIVAKDMPYSNTDLAHKGPHAAEGILHTGRVVSLRQELAASDDSSSVSAFAEGVGVVLLDSRWLKRVG